MKVIWFVNVLMPEYAMARGLSVNGSGGWLEGLLHGIKQFAPSVELSIAFSSPRVEEIEIDGVHYYALGNVKSRLFGNNVLHCIRKVRPDIVHIHGTEFIAQYLPREIISKKNAIVTIQGIMEKCAKNYLGGLTQKELLPHRNLIRALLKRQSPWEVARDWQMFRVPTEDSICKTALNFIGRTDFDKAWVFSKNPSARYFHVDEILRDEFYNNTFDRSKTIKHRIFAGGACSYPLKGGHLLLEAFAAVKKSFPDARLRIAASGRITTCSFKDNLLRDEYCRYIQELSDGLNLQESIDFLPFLSASDVVDELQRAQFFCLPSLMENSPNSLCEAQIVGVPTIAFNVGGISSFTQEFPDYNVRVNDVTPACLADAICALIDRLDAENNLRNPAYTIAKCRHNRKTIICQLLQAYQSISI